MLAKEFEKLPIKDAYSGKRLTVSQNLLLQGEEGNQKGYTISLKKFIWISELWTYKQQQEEAGSVQSLHYGHLFKMSFILVSVCFSYQRWWSEIPIFIWAIYFSAPLVTEE